uniref:DUF4274 domain-containing protein n=1 Tax=Acetivibrio cellulolyticus TaxID=35830 RepID=UPI0001E2D54D|nr:DUF4274 domain-containing protein [Acetivibrio cellulolyticus]
MDNRHLKMLKDLLYSENEEYIVSQIRGMENSLFLHIIAANYNWDNGFKVPYQIINNSNCDLGTALMLFYNADGFRFLQSYSDFTSSSQDNWKEFLVYLYRKIENNEYALQKIGYTPEIGKLQIYKIRKTNPYIPGTILEGSPGNKVEIPLF